MFVGTTLIALALLAALCAPAFAVETHAFTGVSIGPEGKSAPGAFEYISAVEVDHATGDIYVMSHDHSEGGNFSGGSLFRFNSAGEPLVFSATGTNYIRNIRHEAGLYTSQIAIAPPGSVGETAGDIYVANYEAVKIYSAEGEMLGEIGAIPGVPIRACGVATDSAGNVYIKNQGEAPVVRKLVPTGNPATIEDEVGHSIGVPDTCRLAVDSTGRIYLAGSSDVSPAGLLRLQNLGAATVEQVDKSATGVTVEPGTDDFYAAGNGEIRQYASNDSVVSTFGEGALTRVEGVAVTGADGDVYVSDNSGASNGETSRVKVFGPAATLPDAVAEAPSEVDKTSAVLNGTIDADGGPQAECSFEYLTETAFLPQNERQELTIAAGGGTFTLSLRYPQPSGTVHTTAPIAFDASAKAVESAIEQSAGHIGQVTGGPTKDGELLPYTITFEERLGDRNVEQMSIDPTHLTGTQGPGAEIKTVADGHPGGWQGAASSPCSPAGPFTGESTEAVSAEISGLRPGEKYVLRLVGKNEKGSLASDENGSAPGRLSSFETANAFAVKSGTPANLTTTSATLTGSINPEGAEIDECFFEYGRTLAYGSIAPCLAPDADEIGSGTSPVAVQANVGGLIPNAEYDFRLVGGGPEFGGVTVLGAGVPFETHGPPRVISQEFSETDQSGVTVSGSINPGGEATTYVVEYVSATQFAESGYANAAKVPVEGAAIGSGQTAVEVSQRLVDLPPGSSYHVRLFATNKAGSGPGPDQTFRTRAANTTFGPCPADEAFRVEWSALLPDCRAYEQASSPDKNGGAVGGVYSEMFAAEVGSAVTFYTAAFALPPSQRGGTQNYPTYLASRDEAAGSWSSQRLLPPQELGDEAELLGLSPDLHYAVVEASFKSKNVAGLFVIDTRDGAVTQVAPYEPKVAQGLNNFGFDGMNVEGSRIFFESDEAIPTTPVSAPGKNNLFMWDRSTGKVSLVGLLPAAEGGTPPLGGSFGGAYEWFEVENPSTGGARAGSPAQEPLAVAALHAISPSGDQIFFTAAGTGQLYLRRGLGGSSPTTVKISTPNRGVGSPEKPAAFQEATPDGSHAFFLSRQKLTADATTGTNEEGRDLYRWDATAGAGRSLIDIAPDTGDPNGAEVQGLIGVSPDGKSGYFVAHGALAAGSRAGGENLYRFSEEGSGHFRISLLAVLATSMSATPDRRNISPKVSLNFENGRTSRLSENGETLLFTSSAQIPTAAFPAGYDNANPEGISCEAGRCPELYLYSAGTENLTCVSCDPTGETPVGAADFQDQFFDVYFTPSLPPAVLPSRNLSDDGTKVFFQTPDPLLAADTNGHAGCQNLSGTGRCQDVYEWEAVDSGTCRKEEANGGCLYLLSTGQSDRPSYFVGASKSGSDAFIATTSRLVPADRDEADDVYDVREGGGLASQHVIPQPACNSNEACRGAVSSAAPAGLPVTPSFQGPGNEKPESCKKGYVRKGEKCVRKPKHKHKKKHHKKKRAADQKNSGGAK